MSCVVLELALLIKGEAIVRLDWVLVFCTIWLPAGQVCKLLGCFGDIEVGWTVLKESRGH